MIKTKLFCGLCRTSSALAIIYKPFLSCTCSRIANKEMKLMYGMIFSIKSFVNRMSPTDQRDGLISFRTNQYKMNYYETASGLKFILNTDLAVLGNLRDALHQLYSQIYVEYVIKNPAYELGQPITSELFKTKLDEYIRSLPVFTTKIAT